MTEKYRLRELLEGDLEMVLEWRNQEHIRAVMYTDHEITREEHRQWFDRVQRDPSKVYRLFELMGRPVGLVGITDLDERDGTATWAYYLGEEDVPPGTGARMEYLALELAFKDLGVRKLNCEVLAFNTSVVKLHKKFGFEEEDVLREQRFKAGAYQDVVLLSLFKERWDGMREDKHRLLFERS